MLADCSARIHEYERWNPLAGWSTAGQRRQGKCTRGTARLLVECHVNVTLRILASFLLPRPSCLQAQCTKITHCAGSIEYAALRAMHATRNIHFFARICALGCCVSALRAFQPPIAYAEIDGPMGGSHIIPCHNTHDNTQRCSGVDMFDVIVGAGSTLDGSVLSDTFADVAPPARDDAEVRRKIFKGYDTLLQ